MGIGAAANPRSLPRQDLHHRHDYRCHNVRDAGRHGAQAQRGRATFAADPPDNGRAGEDTVEDAEISSRRRTPGLEEAADTRAEAAQRGQVPHLRRRAGLQVPALYQPRPPGPHGQAVVDHAPAAMIVELAVDEVQAKVVERGVRHDADAGI